MRCPQCGNMEDKVIDSRSWKDGAVIRRRRECAGCGNRFTTYEEIEHEEVKVLKKDGRFQVFSPKKISMGIFKACEKRPISPEEISRTVDRIVDQLLKTYGHEIPASEIGERVMMELRRLDEIAYVRFASVYRKFRDVNEFVEEVQNLHT